MSNMTLNRVRELARRNLVLEFFLEEHDPEDAHASAMQWMFPMAEVIRVKSGRLVPTYQPAPFSMTDSDTLPLEYPEDAVTALLWDALEVDNTALVEDLYWTIRDIEDAYGVLDKYTDWLSENGYENS